MSDFLIPLSYNPIPFKELTEVLLAYSKRNHSELITDFEKEICKISGSKYVVALNSGTAAIHLGLKALEVSEDDIVMVSTFTYVASVNPIRYLGAIPFFIDSCSDDWNMDPDLLRRGIDQCIRQGKKPKVILVVHTYGMPARVSEIKEISDYYQIPILEDAAEAIGSLYNGKQVGTFGKIGIFSFNNNKLLTTHGGGALITNDQEIAIKVNRWAGQSRDNLPFYEHREIGFNYKMSPLNAAAGLAQLELFTNKIAERRRIFQSYLQRLDGKVGSQVEMPGVFSNRWITAVILPRDVNVSDVQNELAINGVETRPVWKPMHLQPVFNGFQSCENGCAEMLFETGICLPSGEGLSDTQVNEITGCIF